MTKIIIIDTGCANLSSVKFAFERLNIPVHISHQAEQISSADKLILPGVGTARAAMEKLAERGLIEIIQKAQQPLLGICLGMQLLGLKSAEGDISTLAISNGQTELLNTGNLPLPHMGWNSIQFSPEHPLFSNIAQQSYFYFVHSYAMPIHNKTIASCHYGMDFSAAIAERNFYGVQFHPERSGKTGAQLLKNFAELI